MIGLGNYADQTTWHRGTRARYCSGVVGTMTSHRLDDCVHLGGRESLFRHYRTQNPARYLGTCRIMRNALGIFSRTADVMQKRRSVDHVLRKTKAVLKVDNPRHTRHIQQMGRTVPTVDALRLRNLDSSQVFLKQGVSPNRVDTRHALKQR